MEIRQLETFRVVAGQLSFTRAAATLGYAQSSVTAQIQALEAELGVTLFDRPGRRVVLTEAGQRLLGYAERLLAIAEEARAAVASGAEPADTLTVGAPETILTYRLPRVLQRFRSQFPRVRLVFRPTPNAELQRALSDGTLDLGFGLGEPQRPHGLAVEHLHTESLAVVARPDDPLAESPTVQPADLQGETLLLTRPGCGYRALFTATLTASGVPSLATLDFGSVEAIKQCVRAGLGIAALPRTAVSAEVEDRRLAELHWSGPPLAVSTQMLWHSTRASGSALRAFVEIARADAAS